jgi:hypothetical protein
MVQHKHLIVSSLILFLFPLSLLYATPVNAQSTEISGITASASNTASGTFTDYAFDNNLNSAWNAGAGPTQWILLDLQSTYTVNQLSLTIAQSTKGRTVHEIEGGSTPQNLSHLITLDQITSDQQVVNIPFLEPIPNLRYIKITTTNSPSWVAWKEIKVYQGSSSVNSHLKFFGYISTNAIGQKVLSTYYSELAALGNTNIAWSQIRYLEEFRKLNIKTLMTDVVSIFFANGELAPGWESNWQNYRESLRGYEDIIYGFYIDEPVWRGYSKSAFLTATQTIHDTFPDKAVLVIEALDPIVYDTIPDGYYQYVTDIGFDYYFTFQSTNNDEGWEQYLNSFEKFKPYLQNKKFWVVPDGYNLDADVSARWPDVFERYLSLVLTTNNGTGLLPFLYNGGDEFGYTLRDVLDPSGRLYNPTFRNRNIEVGKAIIRAPFLPGDLNTDGSVDIFDYNLLVANFGNPYTIFDYNILVGNFGK